MNFTVLISQIDIEIRKSDNIRAAERFIFAIQFMLI